LLPKFCAFFVRRKSGGQRQIVWLMRSLFDRTCRHVDEPTSALDPASERCDEPVEDEVQGSHHDHYHDPSVMKMVDTVVEMEGGKASSKENNRFTV
jgi:ABC-type polar amino acid transport system ATPase subunit